MANDPTDSLIDKLESMAAGHVFGGDRAALIEAAHRLRKHEAEKPDLWRQGFDAGALLAEASIKSHEADIFNPSNWPGEDGVYHKPQADVLHATDEKELASNTLNIDPGVGVRQSEARLTKEEWADAILAGFKTEGNRTKADEWEACYAMLFKQLISLPKQSDSHTHNSVYKSPALNKDASQSTKLAKYSPTPFDPNIHCDAERVIAWIDNPERKRAQMAFTEGLERQIAYRFEGALMKRESDDCTQLGKANRDCVRRYRLLADIHNIIEKELVLGKESDSETIIVRLREPIDAESIQQEYYKRGWQDCDKHFGTQQPDELGKEAIAKHIYEAMQWAVRHAENGRYTPNWQEHGNSDAQEEARRCASAILNSTRERESGEVLSMLKKYRVSVSRMCDRWAEGDQAVKNELWKALHGLESDALEIIERAEKEKP